MFVFTRAVKLSDSPILFLLLCSCLFLRQCCILSVQALVEINFELLLLLLLLLFHPLLNESAFPFWIAAAAAAAANLISCSGGGDDGGIVSPPFDNLPYNPFFLLPSILKLQFLLCVMFF